MKLLKKELWDDPINEAGFRVSDQVYRRVDLQVRRLVSDPVYLQVYRPFYRPVFLQVLWQLDRHRQEVR